MQKVVSIEQLLKLQNDIRALKVGYTTNFYLDQEKHAVWIDHEDCFFETHGNTLFIIKRSNTFWNVFYCSTTLEQLSDDLKKLQDNHPEKSMIFDIVGRETQCMPLVEMFKRRGCTEATSLVRMTRLTEPTEYTADNSIRLANSNDVEIISHLLHEHFDASTEQIPYDDELHNYAKQGHILVCEEQHQIIGFLIYEINATTLYLRYWFTHPEFRDKKVGSRLLRRFFEEGKNTKRQIFWVIRTNDNAIKRYKHYGFSEENMYDYILQYN